MRRSASTATWWRGIPASARRGSARPCRWCAFERFDEARARLVDALRLFPNHPSLIAALARVYATAPDARVRNGESARALAEQLLARSRTIDALETMAMALASSATTRRPRGCNVRQSQRPGEPASIKRPRGCATTWRCTSGDSRAGPPGGMTRAGTGRRLPPYGASAGDRDRIAFLREHDRQDLRRLGRAGVPGHGMDFPGRVERLEEHLSSR